MLSILFIGCKALPVNNYGPYSSSSYSSAPRLSWASPQNGALIQGASYGSGYGLSASTGSLGLGSSSVLIPALTSLSSGSVAGSRLGSNLNSGLTLGSANNLNLLSVRQGQQFQQVVPAAIQQIARTVEYRALPYQEQPTQAQVVEVEPSDNPVHLHFKSRSSTLSLSQSHTPAAPQETQIAQTQDEPSRLITEVQKPVIQEVREVISPYRQVTQEINPVIESLHTVVTRGEGRDSVLPQQLCTLF